MIGEAIDVSMVGGPRTQEAMRDDRSKAMGDDRCVYSRWVICVTSPPIASHRLRK